ncbi:MAG TPA: PorV/PorQ family protein, partial [bacterium]|nr:PorV/PorQ family protein [bacterium]
MLLEDLIVSKNLYQFLVTAAFLLVSGTSQAQVSSNSATAFPILSVGFGARAIGMGESFAAVADDLSALYYNPAGLAQIGQPEIALSHNLYLADGFYDNAAGLYPLGTVGTMAFGARYLNYGAIDKRDNFGNLLGTYTPYDISAEGAFGFRLDKDTFLGFGSEWISQNIDGSVQTGLLWNAGLLLKPSNQVALGFNFKNLGVETGGEGLPGELLWGGAFRVPLAKRDVHTLLLSGGGDLAFQGTGSLNAGFEYAFQKTYFLRGGYVFPLRDNQLGGLQGLDFGAGVRLGQFQLDYSFSFEGDFGDIQR